MLHGHHRRVECLIFALPLCTHGDGGTFAIVGPVAFAGESRVLGK